MGHTENLYFVVLPEEEKKQVEGSICASHVGLVSPPVLLDCDIECPGRY